jgi:tRNA pseudouridine38-40 synthase
MEPLAPDDSADARKRRGILLTVAYDGGDFSGWALQREARTVQGELWGAVRALDPRASALRGTSRTDAGVHARGQLVAFDTEASIPPRGWVLGLAAHLPDTISVVRAAAVPFGFEPRRAVRSKVYRYVLLLSPVRDPFLAGYAWRVSDRLNQMEMSAAAAHLLGEHDFRAFRGAADDRENTVRHLFRVEVNRARNDDRILEIVVEGDRFLYRMVRIIAGTLVDVGRGRLDANSTARALESGARTDLGVTAPPDGLFLDSIELEGDFDDRWPG